MSKDEPLALYVWDAEESYLAWKKHEIEVQSLLGTHKLEELQSHRGQCYVVWRRVEVTCPVSTERVLV